MFNVGSAYALSAHTFFATHVQRHHQQPWKVDQNYSRQYNLPLLLRGLRSLELTVARMMRKMVPWKNASCPR